MPSSARTERQASFQFKTWGGVRCGAGPKLRRASPGAPHRPRAAFRPYEPVHVTVRVLEHVWNLRSHRAFAVIRRALDEVRRRRDFRVAHFGVVGNHVHLVVEADGARALATGMRALSIRIARGLNAMMGRNGPVFADRYHARALRSPAEVRNALRYAVGNFASHARRRGEPVREGLADPFSSAAATEPWGTQAAFWPEAPTRSAETWLLRTAG